MWGLRGIATLLESVNIASTCRPGFVSKIRGEDDKCNSREHKLLEDLDHNAGSLPRSTVVRSAVARLVGGAQKRPKMNSEAAGFDPQGRTRFDFCLYQDMSQVSITFLLS